jgi:hypothetical protein
MKNHTKVYLNEIGYDTTDWIPCEVCQAQAVDIHHIEARGMGGSKEADRFGRHVPHRITPQPAPLQ